MLWLWVPCASRLYLPSCSILSTQLSSVKNEGYWFSWQVELQEGPLEQFTHDMEPFLRKQGMPVRLNRGKVALAQDSHDKLVPIAFNFFPPRLFRIQGFLALKLPCLWCRYPLSGSWAASNIGDGFNAGCGFVCTQCRCGWVSCRLHCVYRRRTSLTRGF